MKKYIKILLMLLLCSTVWADNPYRILNNFNAGELSPFLLAREDLAKYQSGCSLMENMIPLPQGGAQKRPGTKYIAEVKTSSLATRILPFEFSTEQSYIIELGNQYMRFFTNGAPITGLTGEEDLSSIGSIVAHWLLNDNLATTAVLDDDGATHNGTASSNTDVLHEPGQVGTGSFDMDGSDYITVSDAAALSFGNDTVDSPFSIVAWFYVVGSATEQQIISKYDATTGSEDREWRLWLDSSEKLSLTLIDESANVAIRRTTNAALTEGWHFVCATYTGQATAGTTAANLITLYVDGLAVDSTATNNASYDAMEAGGTDVLLSAVIGIGGSAASFLQNKLDNVSIHSKELSAAEVATLLTSTSTTAYEISTPYLTADLFELKYEQSADVLYITHQDYESRKLSRKGDTAWTLEVLGLENGPFRSQNITVSKTIAASATTGSVTLTASGHSPFVATSGAGHIPDGSATTNKAQTGALFKLVHPLDTLEYKDTLEDDYTANQTEGVSWMSCGTLYEGATWTWVTDGTWLGTVEIQRNYTIGAAHDASGWETVLPYSGVTTTRNVSTSGTEEEGDADYRVIFTDDTSGTIISYFTTDQIEHIGIVKITAVATSTSATATVLTTLASTDATHKWSESSWSNYRGWPQTVTFFEDRLTFGGNTSQPDTIWASVTSDYENMTAGTEDDDALNFTLSSRQVNVIEWLIGKDKLLIGTSGAEWTLEGGADEPLTPSNVIAKQHSTYGSANLQAVLANESVLFFQRGAEKMRELAYNWELDSYVAPDMTILANLVTDGGIDDTAFQKIPDSILWCIRDDGELPVFSYERKENITAWSRMITTDGDSDSDFESVARIHGSPEDEIWVVVERTIDSNTVRYIEQFQPRDFGNDPCDAFYVDCGITYDSTASSAMTGGTHLVGETVSVLADGVVFDDAVVDANGAITLKLATTTTTAKTVQWGLPYIVQMRTMPLSWVSQGFTLQGRIKRINEVIVRWYISGDFSIGKDADTLETYSITGQTTSQDRKTFPPGYDRNGYVFIYQQSPEPLTLIAIMIEFRVQ